MEIDENTIGCESTDGELRPLIPVVIYSLGFEGEDLLAVYGALRIYLRTLAGQEQEDLEMLARVITLLSQIRPRAVEASKSLALKVTGVKNVDGAA